MERQPQSLGYLVRTQTRLNAVIGRVESRIAGLGPEPVVEGDNWDQALQLIDYNRQARPLNASLKRWSDHQTQIDAAIQARRGEFIQHAQDYLKDLDDRSQKFEAMTEAAKQGDLPHEVYQRFQASYEQTISRANNDLVLKKGLELLNGKQPAAEAVTPEAQKADPPTQRPSRNGQRAASPAGPVAPAGMSSAPAEKRTTLPYAGPEDMLPWYRGGVRETTRGRFGRKTAIPVGQLAQSGLPGVAEAIGRPDASALRRNHNRNGAHPSSNGSSELVKQPTKLSEPAQALVKKDRLSDSPILESRISAMDAFISRPVTVAGINEILGPDKNGRPLNGGAIMGTLRSASLLLRKRVVERGNATEHEKDLWKDICAFTNSSDPEQVLKVLWDKVRNWYYNPKGEEEFHPQEQPSTALSNEEAAIMAVMIQQANGAIIKPIDGTAFEFQVPEQVAETCQRLTQRYAETLGPVDSENQSKIIEIRRNALEKIQLMLQTGDTEGILGEKDDDIETLLTWVYYQHADQVTAEEMDSLIICLLKETPAVIDEKREFSYEGSIVFNQHGPTTSSAVGTVVAIEEDTSIVRPVEKIKVLPVGSNNRALGSAPSNSSEAGGPKRRSELLKRDKHAYSKIHQLFAELDQKGILEPQGEGQIHGKLPTLAKAMMEHLKERGWVVPRQRSKSDVPKYTREDIVAALYIKKHEKKINIDGGIAEEVRKLVAEISLKRAPIHNRDRVAASA